MNKAIYLFGMGTGRCGTVSLSKLLNMQKGSYVTHEQKPGLPWKVNATCVSNRIESIKKRVVNGHSIVGDVALANMTSSEMLLDALPNSKFVIIKRDKTQTIDSFKIKWSAKNKYNRLRHKRANWDHCFPHYELPIYEALHQYYIDYYKATSRLIDLYPNNFKCFNITCLNSMEGVKSILDFCEIPKQNIVYKINIRANRGNRVRKIK